MFYSNLQCFLTPQPAKILSNISQIQEDNIAVDHLLCILHHPIVQDEVLYHKFHFPFIPHHFQVHLQVIQQMRNLTCSVVKILTEIAQAQDSWNLFQKWKQSNQQIPSQIWVYLCIFVQIWNLNQSIFYSPQYGLKGEHI